jgi:hypothetical protein
MRNLFVTARNGKGARLSHDPKNGETKAIEFKSDAATDTLAGFQVVNHTLEQINSSAALKAMPIRLYTMDRIVIKALEIKKHMKAGLTGEALVSACVRDFQTEEEVVEIDRLAGLISLVPNVSFNKISEVARGSSANLVAKQLKELSQKCWAMTPPPAIQMSVTKESESVDVDAVAGF